jgi:hypothetical protein|nr:MAG TPA: hypothetical protein [Bacteriophage sp.]
MPETLLLLFYFCILLDLNDSYNFEVLVQNILEGFKLPILSTSP